MRYGWLAMVLASAMPAATAQAAAQPASDEAAAAGWLEVHGHRLAAPEPSAADLAPLVAKLRGARVIGIGEVTHGTHEDQAFKVALIKELVKAGAIDMLAIEADRSAGVGFDRYIRLGEGDPAALVRSPDFFRIWKGDEFAGLLLWLRAWNLAHPEGTVGVIGIDNQNGSVDADLALDRLRRHDPKLASDLRARMGDLLPAHDTPRVRPMNWIAAHDAAELAPKLAAATALRDAYAAHPQWARSSTDDAEAAYAARTAWQNFDEFALDVKGADPTKAPAEYQSRRDRYMTENLLARVGSDHRTALWAHDSHIVHTISDRWLKEGYSSVGVELRHQLKTDYRTVGFTYTDAVALLTRRKIRDAADFAAPPKDEPTPLTNSGPDSSGRLLALLPGDVWWFDLSDRGAPGVPARFARSTWFGDVGWLVDPATFQTGDVDEDANPFGLGLDALVWFRTMSPQHRWPVVPKAAKP